MIHFLGFQHLVQSNDITELKFVGQLVGQLHKVMCKKNVDM